MSSPVPPHSAHSSFRGRSSPLAQPSGPRLNLALRPSVSLGPFKLGLSLWHAIDYLRSHQSLFPHVIITYDDCSPRLSPVVVSIEPYLNLVFSGTTQRLVIITLDNLAPSSVETGPADRPVNVLYNGRIIHAAATSGTAPVVLTRSALHQILGPTYPGWTQRRSNPYAGESIGKNDSSDGEKASQPGVQEFVLGYPGVAFAFVKKKARPATDKAGGKEADVDKHQPVSTVYIFSGSDPSQPEEVVLPPSSANPMAISGLASPSSNRVRGALSPTFTESGVGSLAEVERAALDPDAINIRAPCLLDAVIEPHRGMTLHFSRASGSRTASPLPPPLSQDQAAKKPQQSGGNGASSPAATAAVDLLLGVTTPQDAMCDLGMPQRIFYKEDDRMRIHAGGSGGDRSHSDCLDGDAASSNDRTDGSQDDGSPFFYNYFDLGIDLLFSSDARVAATEEAAHVAMVSGQARLEKIVVHTNVAGDALFQRYNRCPWKVVGVKGKEGDDKCRGGTATLYRFDEAFRSAADTTVVAASKSKASTAHEKGQNQTLEVATTTKTGKNDRSSRGEIEGLSMELDRGTCAEFSRMDTRQQRSDLDDLDAFPVIHHGAMDGTGGLGAAGPGRARGGPAIGGEGGGNGERDSLVKLDLSTELFGSKGLVLEVGKEGSIVGVVVF